MYMLIKQRTVQLQVKFGRRVKKKMVGDLRGGSGDNRSRVGFAQANRDPMEALFICVPKVEARSSVPGNEICRQPVAGGTGVGGGGGGGGENGVVVKGKPLEVVLFWCR